MKTAATIVLSMYVIFLSCIPCTDDDGCFYMDKVEQMEEPGQPNDHGHDHEGHSDNDICSPFCICTCCGCQAIAIFTNYVIGEKQAVYAIQPFPVYQSCFSDQFIVNIWQPPQIS